MTKRLNSRMNVTSASALRAATGTVSPEVELNSFSKQAQHKALPQLSATWARAFREPILSFSRQE